ncbi:MAG: AAA family ATPase [Planctomycetota bacterium]
MRQETPPSPDTEAQIAGFVTDEAGLQDAVRQLLVGQEDALHDLVTVLLAGGHALVEGVPGTGKTMLVRSVARAAGLDFQRVQFTPDLLPADVIGCDTLVDGAGAEPRIEFRPGPVFTQFLLADEINRGTPRTQSALLEAMQERAVTIGGTRHALDALFTTFATRNPIEMEGTYPLPEAQLDRFLLQVDVAPASVSEMVAISERTTGEAEPEVPVVVDAQRLVEMRWQVRQVIAADNVVRYAAQLVSATQPKSPDAPTIVRECVRYGAGVRALQSLVLCAKVEALRAGRLHIANSDIERHLRPALAHRVSLTLDGEARGIAVAEIADGVRQQIRSGA